MIIPSARLMAPEYFINESTQEHPEQQTMAGVMYSFSMVILEVSDIILATNSHLSMIQIVSGVRPYHHLHNELSVVLHILSGGRTTDRLWELLEQLRNHQPVLRSDINRVIVGLKSLCVSVFIRIRII
jgi:hypothetical protein